MLKVKIWMDAVQIKLNESKTEFIYFRSRQQLTKCHHHTINIKGEIINRSTEVKYLGGHLGEQLNFKQCEQAKCKAAITNLHKIQNIRRFLTKICHQLVLSLAISQLDYGNAILSSCPDVTVTHRKIQEIQEKIQIYTYEPWHKHGTSYGASASREHPQTSRKSDFTVFRSQ